MRSHARWLTTVPILALLSFLLPTPARADGGYGWGVGPVLALGSEGSLSLGWEAGVGTGITLLKLNVGGSYRLSRGDQAPRVIHYVVYEPWLIVGATFGLAATDSGTRFTYGFWEGFPVTLDGQLFGGDNSDDLHPQTWLLTLAIGMRFFGATHQFYLTPKLWRYATIELNS